MGGLRDGLLKNARIVNLRLQDNIYIHDVTRIRTYCPQCPPPVQTDHVSIRDHVKIIELH